MKKIKKQNLYNAGIQPDSYNAVEEDPYHGVEDDPYHGVEDDPYHGVEDDPYHYNESYRGFDFQYVKDPESSGKIKVYINQQPSYNGRSTDLNTIHRWDGKNGSPPFICFKENFKPASMGAAKRLAHGWADKTLVYISTGRTISSQV